VRVKNKQSGKAVDLNLEAEEAACWWSLDETKEFGQGTKVKENFWYEFKSMLQKGIFDSIKLEDLDFSEVRAHLEKLSEAKKNRPLEERKKETEENKERGAGYQMCVIDGK